MDIPPLVGRQDQLRRLAEALERVGRGRSRVVVVIGDSGVGKTRLLAELASRSGGRATALEARGSPLSASIPFAIVAEALEDHLRALRPDQVASLVGDRAADLAPALPSVAAIRRPAGPPEGRLAVLDALARTIGRCAAVRPVLLLLDDLHQADPSTWELVSYLGRNPLDAPVLIVAAVRRHGMEPASELGRLVSSLVKDGLADELRLAPLDAGDVATLAERSLGPAVADTELRSWLFDRTRGNALHVVALLHELRGHPTRRVVPVSVRERVRMQTSELSPRAAEALELAAALGHSFPVRQIAFAMVTGAGNALEELSRRGLLAERGDPQHVLYDFVHPIVQETVYEAMGATRRRELHARLVGTLATEPLAVRAYHVARSALPGDREAVEVLRRAAHDAERAHAHREALGHLQAALDLCPADDPDRWSLLDEIGWQAEQASVHTVALPAPVLAERVRVELRRRGSSGRRAAQGDGELTPREQEVAALARRGQPTPKIAERLHLSERTVESHLARIYAKLGIAGRDELR